MAISFFFLKPINFASFFLVLHSVLSSILSYALQFKSTISSHNETIDKLRNTISLLENNLESEKIHSTGNRIITFISYTILCLLFLLFSELKNQMEQKLTILKDNENAKINLKSQIEVLVQERNATKEELEDIKLNSVQMLAEKDNELHNLQTDNDKQTRELYAAKTEINDLQSMLTTSQQELIYVTNEFTSYKVCICFWVVC